MYGWLLSVLMCLCCCFHYNNGGITVQGTAKAGVEELPSMGNSPEGLLGSQEIKAWLFHEHLKQSTNTLQQKRHCGHTAGSVQKHDHHMWTQGKRCLSSYTRCTKMSQFLSRCLREPSATLSITAAVGGSCPRHSQIQSE